MCDSVLVKFQRAKTRIEATSTKLPKVAFIGCLPKMSGKHPICFGYNFLVRAPAPPLSLVWVSQSQIQWGRGGFWVRFAIAKVQIPLGIASVKESYVCPRVKKITPWKLAVYFWADATWCHKFFTEAMWCLPDIFGKHSYETSKKSTKSAIFN